MTQNAIAQNFNIQAVFCERSGAPFSAHVLRAMAADIEAGGLFADLCQPWADATPQMMFADALPLRPLAGLHALALMGTDEGWTRAYQTLHADALAALLPKVAKAGQGVLARYMTSPPQTNEVRRSLCLVGGFLSVAKETGLPLRCLELGASAGLNMNWDRFGYAFGGRATWGDHDSPLQLSGEWSGGAPPLDADVRVVSRDACDQSPIDVTDPDQALRLRSYIWAEQSDRLERLGAAITIKRATGGVPERADAADWAEAHARPERGVATVVYHSSFMPYPPKHVQARIKAALEAAGAAARAEAPFAWLSKEPDREHPLRHDEVLLRLWRGGEDDGAVRRLAVVHPHGSTVEWLA